MKPQQGDIILAQGNALGIGLGISKPCKGVPN